MPIIIQGLIWFFYNLIFHWPLKGVGLDKWNNSDAKITFVSYFDNLQEDSISSGIYDSKYWASLPNLLKKNQIKV